MSITTNSYGWRQGAEIMSSGVSGSSTSMTTYVRGSGGRLESVGLADGRPRTVQFVNDANGQALRRKEDNNSNTGDPYEIWYRFAGVELGHVGNKATYMPDYAQSLLLRGQAAGAGAFANPDPRYDARFARTVDRITSYDSGSRAGAYTVRGGDTLAGIAAQLWGDAGLWYKLARANGLSGDAGLAAGRVLSVPAGVVRSAYNAATLTQFDPADTLGDLSPSAPQPRARGGGQKCGTFGKILLVAVAVAVAAVVGPAIIGAPAVLGANGAVAVAGTGLSGALGAAGGTIAAGAIAGVAGSIASQGVGLATGIQNSFSWKGVALAGLSGGVGGGLGSFAPFGGSGTGSAIANGAARGALSNAATQGLAMATGLQSKFEWAGVAVGAAVGAGARGGDMIGLRGIGGGLASGMAGAMAGGAARSLIDGTSFGDNLLAAMPDVIGATVGGAVAGVFERPQETSFERRRRQGGVEIADKDSREPSEMWLRSNTTTVIGRRMTVAEKLWYDLATGGITGAIMRQVGDPVMRAFFHHAPQWSARASDYNLPSMVLRAAGGIADRLGINPRIGRIMGNGAQLSAGMVQGGGNVALGTLEGIYTLARDPGAAASGLSGQLIAFGGVVDRVVMTDTRDVMRAATITGRALANGDAATYRAVGVGVGETAVSVSTLFVPASAASRMRFVGGAGNAGVEAAYTARVVAAESEVLSPFTQRYLTESGGRFGNTATRTQNYRLARSLEDDGFGIVGGGGIRSEEYIRGVGPGTSGGTFVDITGRAADGRTVRVQTIGTLSDGLTPTAREAAAAARIRAAFPNDELRLISKGRL